MYPNNKSNVVMLENYVIKRMKIVLVDSPFYSSFLSISSSSWSIACRNESGSMNALFRNSPNKHSHIYNVLLAMCLFVVKIFSLRLRPRENPLSLHCLQRKRFFIFTISVSVIKSWHF